MTLIVDFCTEVQQHFKKLSPLIDADLATALNRGFPEAIKFLLVEYDSPHFSEDFSVSIWPFNRRGEVAADGYWFLKDWEVAVPPETYDSERFEKIDPWALASELLVTWSIDRWRRCASNRPPAFIGHHDSYFKRNLDTGTQTNWDEIVGRFMNA